jgi:hypothetical protein
VLENDFVVVTGTGTARDLSGITRAPTSAVSSPVTRLAGLSQGRSRITERSPVTGFSQTSPTFMGLRSGGPFGSGCDIRAQVSNRGRLVGNYPCWEPDCVVPGHIECEDCVKDREEILLAIISGSEVAAIRQVN